MVDAPPSTRPAPPRARRARRRLAGAALLLGTLAGAGVLAHRQLVHDPRPHFAERYQPVVRVEPSAPRLEDGHATYDVRLTSASGLAADLTVKRPPDEVGAPAVRRPVVLILGGHRTGRDAARLIRHTRGTAIAAMSYPFDGNHRVKGLAVLGEVPRIRRAVLDTPPAVRLALDHLLAQPWVDSTRVHLVGVSFGAPFAVITGALDPRVTHVWSLHGGGDPALMLDTNLAKYVRPALVRRGVAELASAVINGPELAPERWVGRLAPRRFTMINARADHRIPRQAVQVLYDSARAPRTLVWMDGGHVSSRRQDVVQQLVDLVLARMD